MKLDASTPCWTVRAEDFAVVGCSVASAGAQDVYTSLAEAVAAKDAALEAKAAALDAQAADLRRRRGTP